MHAGIKGNHTSSRGPRAHCNNSRDVLSQYLLECRSRGIIDLSCHFFRNLTSASVAVLQDFVISYSKTSHGILEYSPRALFTNMI